MFQVIDVKTNSDVTDDYEAMAEYVLHEKWAEGLTYCDMEGFYISREGHLILADECGNYVCCPPERFNVVITV